MLDAEIRFEVERARQRGWYHVVDPYDLPWLYGLRVVPTGCETVTAVTTETNGRTGLVSVIAMPDGKRRVLWHEARCWSDDEVAARIADHRRRYHSTVTDYR